MTVEVRYLGHLGNNLFEYALGRILAEALDQALVCVPACDAPGWSEVERVSGIVDRLSAHSDAFADAPQSLPGRQCSGAQLRYVLGEKPGWSGHGLDFDHLLRHGAGRHIVLQGYFQRIEYYQPYRDQIRRWFRWRNIPDGPALEPDDIVVHLRQSPDMFVLDRAIDLAFYCDALEGMRGGRVYVCGLGLGAAVRAALSRFDPVYLDLAAIPTLGLLTRARRIVLANSTFSWWGAYLSDAEEILYPCVVRGYWGRERGDVALEVPESRYRYIRDVAVQSWRPFVPTPGANLRLDTDQAQRTRLVAVSAGRSAFSIPVPLELVPLCEWLSARAIPFGLGDIDEAECGPARRINMAKLLIALSRRGVFAIDDEALHALAGFFGIVL